MGGSGRGRSTRIMVPLTWCAASAAGRAGRPAPPGAPTATRVSVMPPSAPRGPNRVLGGMMAVPRLDWLNTFWSSCSQT